MVAQNLFPLLKFFYQDALRVFSDKFGRTESTVYHIIGMVSQFFFDQQSNFITMPRTQKEIKCTEAEFQRRSGITGVIGAINKSHCRKIEHEILSKLTAVQQFCSDGDGQRLIVSSVTFSVYRQERIMTLLFGDNLPFNKTFSQIVMRILIIEHITKLLILHSFF
jgi:beta-lactamase class D